MRSAAETLDACMVTPVPLEFFLRQRRGVRGRSGRNVVDGLGAHLKTVTIREGFGGPWGEKHTTRCVSV